MENREKLIAKIQKLLAMAKHNASNENEAATALRQAESMMRKHDVQFAEIEAQKIKAEDMQMTGTGETRNSGWVWQLAWAASHLTSTMPWKKGESGPKGPESGARAGEPETRPAGIRN